MLRYIKEEGEPSAIPADSADSSDNADDTDSSSKTSLGTTTNNIARVDSRIRLGSLENIIRRKKIEEGEDLTPFIADNINIAFYSNGKKDEEFSKCFDLSRLKSAIINDFYNSHLQGSPRITQADERIEKLEYIINTCCKHDHQWKFEQFKQYGIQIVFGSKDTDSKIVIYQHFK